MCLMIQISTISGISKHCRKVNHVLVDTAIKQFVKIGKICRCSCRIAGRCFSIGTLLEVLLAIIIVAYLATIGLIETVTISAIKTGVLVEKTSH